MGDVLLITLPFFAVCGLGFLAIRSGLLGPEAVGNLNIFAFYFAMPALVIGALARQDIASILDARIFVSWLIAGVGVFAIGYLAIRLVRPQAAPAERAIAGQAASVGNIGFLGLPLGIAAFGDGVMGPMVAALLVDLVVLIPLSIGLLESARRGGGAAGAVRALRGVVMNPFIVAIVSGVALSLTGIGLPAWLERFTDFLGSAASPAALFALGASLAGRTEVSTFAPAALLTTLKLLVHPALLLGLLWMTGAPAGPAAMAVLIAAMPVAGNVFVIAERYGALVRAVSTAVLVSTVIAVASVSLVLAWALQQQG
ncbi:MAG: AEC family transporter [Rhodobiaceae bacterium]|nr:AEC family transporter [Rhodobiaceae bacterium]MCC0054086.1 AEC family transporter [Rhodobiaceae bacterium]